MASNRHHVPSHQGHPLKPTLASNRTGKTPVAPRLAASNASSPFPRVATAKVAAGSSVKSHTSTLQPSLIEEATTPVKNFLTDNITPRSSSRKSRVDSTNTTPSADDTPSHARPKLASPTQSEPNFQRRSVDDGHGRPPLSLAKPKSFANSRETARGAPATRSQVSGVSSHHAPPRITKDTSPMFFHADQARSQPDTHSRPVAKKAPTFFYANGHGDGQAKSPSRGTSPDPHSAHNLRSPYLPVPPTSRDHALQSPSSPPLSSTSSRSPFFPNPSPHTPSFRPSSPPKENVHLSYRGGASQIFGRSTTSPSLSALPDKTPHHLQQNSQRPKSSAEQPRLRVAHAKSQSVSSIDTGSPDQPHAINRLHRDSPAAAHAIMLHSHEVGLRGSLDGRISADAASSSRTSSPRLEEPLHSPGNHIPDLAAEARRERKVLDLEISNSSLLAINKSLEREIRKQKTELKRFRRLSRAGQFNVAASDSPGSNHLSTLDEEGDELYGYDDALGRPSSPFLSEPAESDDDDDGHSTTSSGAPLSPTAQADKDAKHRAADEQRLRLDLDRHRELLLDTQRMNKSLQRCLAWTEDLIKHGKKALEYQAPLDVKLGGRILTDDDVDEEASVADSLPVEEDILNVDDLVAEAMGGYFGLRDQGPKSLDRQSGSVVGSGSEKDSGVEFGSAVHTPLRSSHTVEFGKPTPLRNPLFMNRDNTTYQNSVQENSINGSS